MHLSIILAFAFLFWRAELVSPPLLLPADDIWLTLSAVLVQPLAFGLATFACGIYVRRLLVRNPSRLDRAQHFHHRTGAVLRFASLVGFAALVFLTAWPDWFAVGRRHPPLQIIGDWIVLTPLLGTWLLFWWNGFLTEAAMRTAALSPLAEGESNPAVDGLGRYLEFQLRHQFLTVTVPMSIILMAANIIRGYRDAIERFTIWIWGPDVLLGGVALAVFLAAPVMLRWIWRTRPLEPGPLRARLEAHCRRIGLRVREILVWDSGGMMVNAAVMGILAPIRFVLLSDSLLRTLPIEQVEAVFGHEAGHVRHRHIQHLLIFAFLGWLIVAGIMEGLAQTLQNPASSMEMTLTVIQGVGIAVTILFWGVGFGWLSRRFERQADAFGAWCVTPPGGQCQAPCSVHNGSTKADPPEHRVCATGAAVFASALRRVAQLNGIPPEERSWRHSSIASRIRFLTAMAADPRRAEHFHRDIRRWKVASTTLAAFGSVAALAYGILMF